MLPKNVWSKDWEKRFDRVATPKTQRKKCRPEKGVFWESRHEIGRFYNSRVIWSHATEQNRIFMGPHTFIGTTILNTVLTGPPFLTRSSAFSLTFDVFFVRFVGQGRLNCVHELPKSAFSAILTTNNTKIDDYRFLHNFLLGICDLFQWYLSLLNWEEKQIVPTSSAVFHFVDEFLILRDVSVGNAWVNYFQNFVHIVFLLWKNFQFASFPFCQRAVISINWKYSACGTIFKVSILIAWRVVLNSRNSKKSLNNSRKTRRIEFLVNFVTNNFTSYILVAQPGFARGYWKHLHMKI